MRRRDRLSAPVTLYIPALPLSLASRLPFRIPANGAPSYTKGHRMSTCTLTSTQSPNRFRLVFGVVATLASLTSAVGAYAADDIVDPCKLVTAAEVQAVLGAPATMAAMRPPSRPDKTPARICSFQGQNGKMMTLYAGHRTKAQFTREGAGMESIAGVGVAPAADPPSLSPFLKREQ